MKKHFKNYFFIIVITSILMLPLLQDNYHSGHDTKFHIANVLAVKEQMKRGNFTTPILGHIANNFGYGTRLFYPVLPHTITAGVSILLEPVTNDITHAFILIHFLTIILSAIAMYHCAYQFSKKTSHALLSATLYITMPYYLSNIYRRCALAESFVFIFIPIIFTGVLSLLENNSKKFYPLFIIGYIGAFLSHFTITIYFTILLAIFLLIYRKRTLTREFLKPFVFATISVILIIFPFVEPMITHKLLKEYVVFQKGAMYKRIASTGLTPWDYLNPFPILDANDTKYHLLVVTSLMLFATIYLRKKIKFPKFSKGIILFGFISFLLSSIIFPWLIMPSFFKMIQFPWRLVTFVSFSLSLILPLCLEISIKHKKITETLLIVIMTLSAYQTISFSTNEYIDINEIWWNGGMGWQREYLPVRMKNNLNYYYKRGEQILAQNNENVQITILENSMPNLTFQVTDIYKDTTIEMPRIFYFGYRLTKNGKNIPLYENEKGFLESEIEEEGKYILKYEGTILQKIARVISFLTVLVLLILASLNRQRKN